MREGWEIKTLGEVVSFERGLTYSKKDEVELSSNIVLRSNNVDLSTNRLILSELRYIKDSIKVPDAKRVKKNSLILCTANGSKNHLGKVALIDEDYGYAFGGFMGLLTPNGQMNSRYLFYALTSSSYKEFIGALSDGANINNLKFEDLKRFSFPVPPFSEQQHIVKILDEAFDSIGKAKANIEKNLKNAKELTDSYMQEIFSSIDGEFEEKTMSEIAEFSQGIQVGLEKHQSVLKRGYVRFIRIIDYTQNTDDIRYVPDPGQKYWVSKEDIVMVRYGTPGLIGRGKEGVIANNLFKINIKDTKLTKDFLSLYLSLRGIQKFLSSQGSSTMPALNFSQLGKVLVRYPKSVATQNEIVLRLNSISAHVRNLELLSKEKLRLLEDLKRSLLLKAFSGELTAATKTAIA